MTRLERRTFAKTADYTVKTWADAPGTVFTNAGAGGAVTFSLPTPTRGNLGHWYHFRGVADQNIIVSAGAGKAVTFNNAAAASLAAQTGGQKIGALIEAQCIETSSGVFAWHLAMLSNGVTATVA